MTTAQINHALLVPGMPHLLAKTPADSWKALSKAVSDLGEELADDVDTWLIVSTQWFTVLGFQFQTAGHLAGVHVDENWYAYDYGELEYDLRTDAGLTESWISSTAAAGFDVHRTDYDGFPIDTGTIVASTLLDPAGRKQIASASMNLYAGPELMTSLGQCASQAASTSGRRVGVVAVSGLSTGVHQRWIEPTEENIFSPEHESWNLRVLELLEAGRIDDVMSLRDEFSRSAAVDSQFRAVNFLAGTGLLAAPAENRAYGSIWGTGATVLHWSRT
ncbi:MAG: hypothetical protein WBP59_17865 [Ilumatobacteraceae bacterium]